MESDCGLQDRAALLQLIDRIFPRIYAPPRMYYVHPRPRYIFLTKRRPCSVQLSDSGLCRCIISLKLWVPSSCCRSARGGRFLVQSMTKSYCHKSTIQKRQFPGTYRYGWLSQSLYRYTGSRVREYIAMDRGLEARAAGAELALCVAATQQRRRS